MEAQQALKSARRTAAALFAPDPVADSVPEDVAVIWRQTVVTLGGHAFGIVLVTWMYHAVVPPRLLLGWGAVALTLWSVRVWHYLRYRTVVTRSERDAFVWLRQWRAGAVASGALWGAAGWLFLGYGSHYHSMALVTLIFGYCVAAIQVLATQPRTYLGFISVSLLPVIVRLLREDSPDALGVVIVLTIIYAFASMIGRNVRRAHERTVLLRREAEHLAEQLRVEKAAAEAARREAEVANRAKTQFFAAASHDLRQPLHALGLFAEALRQRSHRDEEVAHLVNSINSSVDALDGLFNELLDITKIDSGGVEVRPEHIDVGELFRRIKLHFEPVAFEKGLALRFRGGRHFAHADPLLVERIVRNLVSNAIRYTHDGSVLVAARRRGERLLLQVWDTGVGISEADRERIFDEFYQVAGDAPAPSQRKGLGLGLAIVKRLADLMGAPLELRSQPGRGTVFTLELPLGRAPRALPDVPRKSAVPGVTLDGRRILVVEDEPAVRSGLEVLLRSWGAEVRVFDGVRSCLDWSQQPEAAAWRPDLLVVDYRLESGHTGIEVLAALRQRYSGSVPAIVVTGSLMSSHEREAQQHDFHLLIKPVVPNKLRAMIAFKLGVR